MALPLVARREGKAHSLELKFQGRDACVRMAGELDLLAAPDIARLLESLDGLAVTIRVDLEAVTFLDSSGLQPLIDATRRRREHHMPSLVIEGCSRAARRLLDCAQLHGDPLLDVEAWDSLWHDSS